jgi:hypothetical protein
VKGSGSEVWSSRLVVAASGAPGKALDPVRTIMPTPRRA